MKLFCKHKWEVVTDHIFESALEIANKNGHNLGKCKNIDPFESKYFCIIACTKCGKTKSYRESK